MQYDTEQEYIDAIKRTRSAIARVELIGQEHENESGGSKRRTKEASLPDLEKRLTRLQKEYKLLTGHAFVLGSGW